jgi:NAD(P)H-hydrate epimerase
MTLPDWLRPLPDAAQQRALDAWAIEQLGIPGLELMERAGSGLARAVARRCPEGRVAVVCGKGNNGGDGFVAARVLHEAGREVEVALPADPESLRGDARANHDRLPAGVAVRRDCGGIRGAAAVIDAILGTGSSGAPRDAVEQAIGAINDAGAREVIACDVPSGVDASTGEVAGVAVRASATVTFHAGKPGLFISPGKEHAGEVTVIDIGIPPAGGPIDQSIGLVDEAVLELVPARGAASTKFAAGSVLVCGGSTGLTGAPCLASEGAMRAGAGYVTACIPESLNLVFETRLLEAMSVPLPDRGGALSVAALEPLLARCERADALVLGPGLGREPESAELARAAARAAELPLVLDADGLNAHAGRPAELAARRAATVLTPHGGELARLLGVDGDEVRARRLHCARAAAEASGAVVVLKGDDTLVAAPGGSVAISPGNAPALATAGTGDVLSGVIAAYLAKRMDPFAAACAAVLVHLRAGRLAASRIGPEGVIARDVIEALPRARASGSGS